MLVMLAWLWRFWMMCIVVMAIVPVMHYAINLMLCEMTLLAMSMFVKAMLAFLHVLVHLLVHFRTCLGVISNHMTATMFVMNVIDMTFCLSLVAWVVMLVYIVACEACNCAEDHHSDYHHAFECCLHILYLL